MLNFVPTTALAKTVGNSSATYTQSIKSPFPDLSGLRVTFFVMLSPGQSGKHDFYTISNSG